MLNSETILPVDLILIQGDLWLFMHDASGNWRPFGVLLTIAFLGLQLKFKNLFGSKLHNDDWIFRFSCLAINKFDRLYGNILIPGIDIGGLNFINIRSWPLKVDLKIKIYRAPIAIALAVTLVEELIIIDSSTNKGNEPASMGQELVMERRSILMDGHDIDSHGWNLSYDYTSEGIRYC